MFIGFMGVPGCGKSATASELAKKLNVAVFLEPEESEWSDLVTSRDLYGEQGPFLGLQWFRNTRVPGYLRAAAIHLSGGTAIVDSMYDKLIAKYMSSESMRWLISPEIPYYAAAKKVAEVDYAHLPNPTHLVFVSVEKETWEHLLNVRGRNFDAGVQIRSHLAMQDVMYKSAQTFCKENGIRFILHKQRVGSALETANDVSLLLAELK